jgi:hypothetical protein
MSVAQENLLPRSCWILRIGNVEMTLVSMSYDVRNRHEKDDVMQRGDICGT